MPNIAAILKSEISRVARKEVRTETLALKKAGATYRKEIAALKRRIATLERSMHRIGQGRPKPSHGGDIEPIQGPARFNSKGLRSQRKRLGLSAPELGLLLGTSVQSVYNWEQGKVRPHANHLEAIAALKTLGRKDAAAVVASRRSANR